MRSSTAHPDHPLAEETLNNLATHYVLASDDEQAATTLDELYARFPAGPHANRAAWRAGWWKYKAGEYARPRASSNRPRRRFHMMTTGRRGSTGPRGPTSD